MTTLPAVDQFFNIATHNGKITVENVATGEYRTFRIKTQPKDAKFAPGERIVSLLTGPDNETSYTGFGFVKADGRIVMWKKHKDSTAFRAYCKLLTTPRAYHEVRNTTAPQGYAYHYEGRCRVCNRTLTTPESVQSGIGPICDGRG